MVTAIKDIIQFGTETVNTSIPDLGTVTSLEGIWTLVGAQYVLNIIAYITAGAGQKFGLSKNASATPLPSGKLLSALMSITPIATSLF